MKNLVIANWKCNPSSLKEAKNLFNLIKKQSKDIKKTEIIIVPPFIYLPFLKGLDLGAQDCFWEDKGAFTGEISPLMLKNLSCKYVIIGHSERRKYFNENNEIINKKIKAALRNNLIPILCIGETEEEKKKKKTKKIIREQLENGLKDIKKANLIIAYEPIWAIGTGNFCDFEIAKEIKNIIFETLSKIFNKNNLEKIKIIYGGSVNFKNASDYIKKSEFNGLLVGGASLKSQNFVKIIKSIEKLNNIKFK